MAPRLGARRVRVDWTTTRRSPRSSGWAGKKGILPALESSHAIAYACRLAPTMPRDAVMLVNLSGRGDKDVLSVQKALDAAAGGR